MTNEEIIATMSAEELEDLFWDCYADELAESCEFCNLPEIPEDF